MIKRNIDVSSILVLFILYQDSSAKFEISEGLKFFGGTVSDKLR